MTPANIAVAVERTVVNEGFVARRISPNRFGLVLGTFLAAWHALWAALVWAGAAQPFMDFIFRLHMIEPPYRVAEFNLGTAATLVLVTAAIGYAGGWALGFIWNRFGRRNV